MKIALGDRSIQEMCDLLGVHRATIGRWIADKGAPPKIAYLRQWALATGVNYEWLRTGWAPWDSNPQPTDWGRRSSWGQSPLGAAA